MVRTDCIYFEKEEKYTRLNHCKRSRSLDRENSLCDHCRLWDAYIPSNSTSAQIDKALTWQNMPYCEQPDYEEYFNK